MNFKKYQHVERFGSSKVKGIEYGKCFVFPKIDGTNACVYLDNDEIKAGSRRKELTETEDNFNFFKTIRTNEKILNYLKNNPTHRLFGEWLVPHSLKTYKQDAWRKFYIFDVGIDDGDELFYLPYEEYSVKLEEFGLDYIKPIGIVQNTNYEELTKYLGMNTFLIEEDKGVGEGVVIKNYEYKNRAGQQVWAKIISSEFNQKGNREKNKENIQQNIEERIIADYCTTAFIEKEFAKLQYDSSISSKNLIPRLLGNLYYELINEEGWNFIKKFRNPTVNYKTLQHLLVLKVRETLPELFCK